jgi:hypothetical protein
MAIGPSPQILLGCNASANANNPTAIINKFNGTIFATVNQQSGADEVWFNNGVYFLARSSAVDTQGFQLLGIIDSGSCSAATQSCSRTNAVFTAFSGKGNAHSVAAEPVKNQVYVPIPSGASNICGSLGGVDANGCIAVFTAQ